VASALALAAAALLVPVLAGLALSVRRALGPGDGGWREMALALLGLLGFLFAVRLRYPFAPHNDFRFVLPVVLPCSVMAALAIGRARRWLGGRPGQVWRRLGGLPALGVVAFCAGSVRVLLWWP
jgi:cell division protein FtsW (lipid II flippase)